jgi:acid phosphatase (class A)
MKHLPLFALAFAVLFPASAFAREPIFVTPDQSRSGQILATPPATDSETTKAELAELHRIEAERTETEAAAAKLDDENETIFLFKNVMGEKFTAENLPAFATRVRNDEGLNSDAAKSDFHRDRPYNLDKTLHPVCKTKTKDDAYPSGHASSGYLLGLTLIDLVPEKRDAILARAEDYAHGRLVCGVHYPSDLPASKLVAYTVHAIMEANPQYRKEMEAARAELRKALGLDVAAVK